MMDSTSRRRERAVEGKRERMLEPRTRHRTVGDVPGIEDHDAAQPPHVVDESMTRLRLRAHMRAVPTIGFNWWPTRFADGSSWPPDAPPTRWTTRELERNRFRSADGRVDRSVPIVAGIRRRTVAPTDAPDSSPHSGPERTLRPEADTSLRESGTLPRSVDIHVLSQNDDPMP